MLMYSHFFEINEFQLMFLFSTGWVNELMAGASAGAKGFMFFICNMELTNEGQGMNEKHSGQPSLCFV